MKAIMVMFDSLNRHMLPPYGCDWIHAQNFQRLAERSVTFDNCYVGSMPCMPARRELHTGRYNFLHRSWGPMEPFDDSMPEILKKNGVYTHLVSDHQHYWEDGGCTYHTRYSSWEISRGQEGDTWKGHVKDPDMTGILETIPKAVKDMMKAKFGQDVYRQDVINRGHVDTEEKMSQAVTFAHGLEFIDTNYDADQWFLQIETFDPHEPFFASQRFKDLYPDVDYTGLEFDWPPYTPVRQKEDEVEHCRKCYFALLSMCDYYLGKVLDAMDKYDLWKDTLLIVNTDHGFLLGEHGWWSKSVMPYYNEVARTPFFVWDPRFGIVGERRKSLVQTIDIAPTLLDYFNVGIPKDMMGRPLKDVITEDKAIREAALFGTYGNHINITDGRHVYMRSPSRENKPLYEYTLMPTHMRSMFKVDELQDIQLAEPFGFTKGCRTMRIGAVPGHLPNPWKYGSKLFDLDNDPGQLMEVEDEETEVRLINAIKNLMETNEAPEEQYLRIGIPKDREFTLEMLKAEKELWKQTERIEGLPGVTFEAGVYCQLTTLLNVTPQPQRSILLQQLKKQFEKSGSEVVTKDFIVSFVSGLPFPEEQKEMTLYSIDVAGRTR